MIFGLLFVVDLFVVGSSLLRCVCAFSCFSFVRVVCVVLFFAFVCL